MITISTIIPCHNNSYNLWLVFQALGNQSSSADEIICVDDSSSPKELWWIKKICDEHGAQLINLPTNTINFGRRSLARNIGSQIARGDVCLYLDGDMLLGPDYLKSIRFLHSISSKIMIKGIRYALNSDEQSRGAKHCLEIVDTNDKKQIIVDDIYRLSSPQTKDRSLLDMGVMFLGNEANNISRRIFLKSSLSFALVSTLSSFFDLRAKNLTDARWDYCASNNLSVRRNHVKRIGNWDERFIGWGEEDMDFAYRLFMNGVMPILPEDGAIYAYHLDHEIDIENNARTLEKNAEYFVKKFPEMSDIRRNVYSQYGIEI